MYNLCMYTLFIKKIFFYVFSLLYVRMDWNKLAQILTIKTSRRVTFTIKTEKYLI